METRSARVLAPTAKAFVRLQKINSGELEVMSVKDAAAAAEALGDPGNEQNCPLCDEYFSTPAFVAHAADCIRTRAPRRQFWVPAGTPGALAVFPEKAGWREDMLR